MSRAPITQKDTGKLIGEEKDFELKAVKPNRWNPNRMSSFQMESLKQELMTTGWLRSMKLLVWGSDENGEVRNIIIDGEHRWKLGKQLGFKVAPMVFLHGITEIEAKKLTIKIDHKRGTPDNSALSDLLISIREELDVETYSLEMGIDVEALTKLLKIDVPVVESGLQPSTVTRIPKVTIEFSTSEKRDQFKAFVAKVTSLKGDTPAGDILCEKFKIKMVEVG